MLYHISQQQSSDDHQYSHQDSSFYDPAVLFLRGLSVRFLCLSFLRFWILQFITGYVFAPQLYLLMT